MKTRPKILCVDDHPENLLALEMSLSVLDVEIVSAHSGEEALAKTLEDEFALVLLDVQMPGMDGFEVLELLRKDKKTQYLPVIFLTAIYRDQQHILKGIQFGAIDFITKPIEREILVGKVKLFIELYEQRKEIESYASALEQANEELDRFAAVVSHDLKSPLNNIMGFSAVLDEEIDAHTSETAIECINLISDSSQRMSKLINNLLSYTKVNSQDVNFTSVDLNLVLKNLLKDMAHKIQESQAVIEVGELPQVHGDEVQLAELFQNLITNALKFIPEGMNPNISIDSRSWEKTYQIRVKDNGIGFPPEQAHTIFKAFKRLESATHYEGTGLGLSTCKRIADRHRGSISAESESGAGATFYIYLPKGSKNSEKSDSNLED